MLLMSCAAAYVWVMLQESVAFVAISVLLQRGHSWGIEERPRQPGPALQVMKCSKRYVHDWRSCPFAHPTENARRRDPREYRYMPLPCPDYKRGICLLVSRPGPSA